MAEQNTSTTKRDRLFREKAESYVVCFSEHCPQRETCLRWILREYLPADAVTLRCVNPANAQVKSGQCPLYRNSEPRRMPYGILPVYHDMPGWMERSIKKRLINKFSRKRYYEYHNGTRPMTPEVEQFVRDTIKASGWAHEPQFMGYTEEYLW